MHEETDFIEAVSILFFQGSLPWTEADEILKQDRQMGIEIVHSHRPFVPLLLQRVSE